MGGKLRRIAKRVGIICRLALVHPRAFLLLFAAMGASAAVGQEWPEYAGSLAGQRYSAAQQIDRVNVSRLQKVWALDARRYEGAKPRGSFEATPVLWQGGGDLARRGGVCL